MPTLKAKPNITLYNFSTSIGDKPKEMPSEKYFLFFGRLSYEKGVKTLLEAFKGLPQCNLKIVGTGPKEDELKAFAQSNRMGNVSFLGYKQGKELTGLAKNGIIHLINSGATTLDGTGQQTDAEGNPTMKPSWEITEEEVNKCLEATTWYPANRDYFRGGGFSSNFLSKGGMPVTMSRLNLVKGLGPVLQIAEGWTVEIDPEIHKILDERTDRTWPTTWFVPRLCDKPAFKDVYSVMNNWGANHGAISYGHIGQDLITMASILRIPVCMHNVEDDKIFRPAAWNAFGMDKEGADYRACQNYGPIYK